ncbi:MULTISPECIES: LysR substrate-binding domain-containing protein [Bosea]|jgi:DNA-binding transcriptional LysR family regulator|uniref:LysR substrate-binding domain-containing protein n=1 Tax=Bosea TaxID=85413 RepID=UPI0021502143|nr:MULTISPECIES: LysR substrate-binding domain-containing protein [Bosea]MCR4522287.1 LysR substrate-binding domain-containing protein [Bosea sp. 47.2.35]MDR6828060.1 DNA-binding transcriptional LysR family regulator [Bosea robiniae]MDR6894790.1 DNA-binding transcriptional LysR family regulator [Bosea sp. BE109]MDR7138166.1 DNA-binding transcriptional LysR family regulator [Bosea sp. BE168]MDR7174865.1 DNA-binding transcriptional LysR family regulator [Bosea sp. BE271]
MLNPRQIEAFRTVIVTGGITAAAQALNVTQPAVTRLIQDLQYALGLPLFVKRGARLVPTNEALSLYREVERQFVGLERIENAARNLRDGRAGSLRVAALPAFNVGFLPRVVGRYLKQKPDLEIAIYGSISSQVVDWVTSGFCELGFAQLPLDFPGIDIEILPAMAPVAVLPTGHRLAAKAVLAPEDFVDEPFISLEQSTQLRYRIDALFSAHRVARQTRVETPLSMIACGLVAAGAGLSVVDPFTAEEYRGKGVEVRPLRPSVTYDIAIIWGAGRFRSAVAQDFAETVRTAALDFAGTAAA